MRSGARMVGVGNGSREDAEETAVEEFVRIPCDEEV